jgi:hypothetical protein
MCGRCSRAPARHHRPRCRPDAGSSGGAAIAERAGSREGTWEIMTRRRFLRSRPCVLIGSPRSLRRFRRLHDRKRLEVGQPPRCDRSGAGQAGGAEAVLLRPGPPWARRGPGPAPRDRARVQPMPRLGFEPIASAPHSPRRAGPGAAEEAGASQEVEPQPLATQGGVWKRSRLPSPSGRRRPASR